MTRIEIGEHLVIDPEICHGRITFRGTRIPVDTVLTFLAKGYSVDQLLRSWPELIRPAIEEAIYQILAMGDDQLHRLSWPSSSR